MALYHLFAFPCLSGFRSASTEKSCPFFFIFLAYYIPEWINKLYWWSFSNTQHFFNKCFSTRKFLGTPQFDFNFNFLTWGPKVLRDYAERYSNLTSLPPLSTIFSILEKNPGMHFQTSFPISFQVLVTVREEKVVLSRSSRRQKHSPPHSWKYGQKVVVTVSAAFKKSLPHLLC